MNIMRYVVDENVNDNTLKQIRFDNRKTYLGEPYVAKRIFFWIVEHRKRAKGEYSIGWDQK